jgi:folate-binding protein YgfZ
MSQGVVTTEHAIQNQARALQSSVLVIAEPERAAITVARADRLRWLNGLVTCDLAKLGPHDGAYGFLVEKKGRIQTDLFVVQGLLTTGCQALAIAVPHDARGEVLAMLDHHLMMENAELGEADLTFFMAHGPRAPMLASLVEASSKGGRAPAFFGTLDVLGTGGAVLAVASSAQTEFEAKLSAEVAKIGGVMGDRAGWDAVRIEHGLPRFGVEFDTSHYPQEASLDKLGVSFDKGCYLGQEVLYMLSNRGHVKRKLVALEVEGSGLPPLGAPVTTPEGDAVGEVKSAAVGPTSGHVVTIAMVKWEQAKPGAKLCVAGRSAQIYA